MPRRVNNASAFPDVMADGLFDIDVLARLHGPDGGQGVPVVWRGDADGVDALVVHDAPQILHDTRLRPLTLHGKLHGRSDDGGIDVAKVRHDAIVSPGITGHMAAALPAHADNGDIETFIGADR